MKGETPDLVGVVNIHFLATHPAHMLFQGPGHYHWISNDYGRTYEPIETPGRTLGYGAEIRIHPRKPDWLLSRVRRNECLKVSPNTGRELLALKGTRACYQKEVTYQINLHHLFVTFNM